MRALAIVIVIFLAIWLLVASVAHAEPPRPTLDDFYERTRERDADFERCTGYCDGEILLAAIAGAETSNPSTDALMPALASGVRLGGEAGVRGGEHDVARTTLALDVLRVHGSGAWLTDVDWHTTAFKAYGREHDDSGLHLSFDSVVAHRTDLQPSDAAELQERPYSLADVEAEVAPTGPYVDKDGFLALPIGVANRLRWADGFSMERRTTVSAALAIRGFPKHLRDHAQLDVLRVKVVDWSEGARAWTLSTGYQRLPQGIDTLPIWALAGYEWAGPRGGAVYQVGGAYRTSIVDVGAEAARHFELDPATAMVARVTTAGLTFRHRVGPVRYGIVAEHVSIEDRGSLNAVTPELAVRLFGFELGARYRLAWMPRFTLSLDYLF